MKKPTYYTLNLQHHPKCSLKRPTQLKIGDRVELLVDSSYNDKLFKKGSKATFLGWNKKRDFGEYYMIWPMFQFDGDSHKNRVLDEFRLLRKYESKNRRPISKRNEKTEKRKVIS